MKTIEGQYRKLDETAIAEYEKEIQDGIEKMTVLSIIFHNSRFIE